MTNLARAKIEISDINTRVKNDAKAFFEECDRKYEKKVRSIAERIATDPTGSRIIMLSGPSSSCKTTTSLKIQRELAAHGATAVTISMDDFFKSRDKVPLLPDGTQDFESIDALNIDLLEQTLSDLLFKGAADFPVFNFKAGEARTETRHCELKEGQTAIVEGIHALDPRITDGLPGGNTLKLYVSVSSDFVDNGQVVLSARDVRLIRRTIRDQRYRNSLPEDTLDMWDAVCRGEDLYIRPFKKFADDTINSVFACEPCLMQETARQLFNTVSPESRHFEKAQGILNALSRFEAMPLTLAPETCVLREFTGGSVYYRKSGKAPRLSRA